MEIIREIAKLRTRNLKNLTASIFEDNFNYSTNNYMMLSSICKVSCNTQKITKDTYRTFYNNIIPDLYVKFKNRDKDTKWECNIQQVKREYAGVIFAIYFSDLVCFYKIEMTEFIKNAVSQHRDNLNELQYMVRNNNIRDFDRFIIGILKYEDIFEV